MNYDIRDAFSYLTKKAEESCNLPADKKLEKCEESKSLVDKHHENKINEKEDLEKKIILNIKLRKMKISNIKLRRRKMTELEHVLKKHSSHLIAICNAAHIAKYNHTCDGKACRGCDLYKNSNEILKILLSEHKEIPKLINAEHTIFENIDPKFHYVARNKNGDLFIYMRNPYKDEDKWSTGASFKSLSAFNHLFPFIKWEDEEPWNIKELLEG